MLTTVEIEASQVASLEGEEPVEEEVVSLTIKDALDDVDGIYI